MEKKWIYFLVLINILLTLQVISNIQFSIKKNNDDEKKILELNTRYNKLQDIYEELSNEKLLSSKKDLEIKKKINFYSKKNRKLINENIQFTNLYVAIGGN